MNIQEPLPRAAAVYVDFNRDFMQGRTGSIGMAVLVPCRFLSRFLASKNQSGFLATERALLVSLQDFRINLDFNQDFMHSRTGSIGIAVLVPLSISISISIRKIDTVEQYLNALPVTLTNAPGDFAHTGCFSFQAVGCLLLYQSLMPICNISTSQSTSNLFLFDYQVVETLCHHNT
jgi:hypothetical protein